MAVLNLITSFMSAVQAAITPSVAAPGSMWHLLILKTFAFVADYGWRIVVFTVLLKLVISPLDFYQRYKMNKNQKITERLKPTIEKLQKQYAGDKQMLSQKQMELNRKEGYSYFSSCLPMILTMVIFITLWLSMQTIAQYMTFREYTSMYDEYRYVYSQIYDPVDPENVTEDEAKNKVIAQKIGQEVVFQMYYEGIDDAYIQTLNQTIKDWQAADVQAAADYEAAIAAGEEAQKPTVVVPEGFTLPDDFTLMREDVTSIKKVQASFLWIQNIWAPDVPWGSQAVLDWSTFLKGINKYQNASKSELPTEVHQDACNEVMYNEVMGKILSDTSHSRTNGYLILPILVVLLSIGTQILSMFQQKRAGQVNATGGAATSMKVMMVIMPIMLAVFAIQYASIFALYMVVNSATTLFFNFTFTGIIRLIDKRRHNRNYGISVGSTRGTVKAGADDAIIHYIKGANPNAGIKVVEEEQPEQTKADKKAKKAEKAQSSSRTVVRGSRPDPNELMSRNTSRTSDKPPKKR
ncbi:MAG: membrane protein insertase YidC [Clostridiales bacterium]|nr:membrane protein insertase YidC [Clostridiales bacterium]